jgi:hypothetical protein
LNKADLEVHGMGIRKEFNKIFGIEDSVEEEKKRFVQRVNQLIFHEIDTRRYEAFHYKFLFEMVCFALGVNAQDFPQREMPKFYEVIPATIRTLTKDDFNMTLRVLCILHLYLPCKRDEVEGQKWLSNYIELILSQCTCDIGVRWKDGFFYPSGAEELDKPLIEETLTWLKDYPNERKDYKAAIQIYLVGEPLPDVIKNCYLSVEGIAREVLGNQKTLDNNKDELLTKMNLSDGWKSILATYIKYAHDYRHASPERHNITKQEAEAYLYMTGLIIRLVVESNM